MDFSGGSVIKNLPANAGDFQEMQARSLGWEDPLEEEMATHSSIPAWEIPRIEEPGGLQPVGLQRLGCQLVTKQQHVANAVNILASSLSLSLWTKILIAKIRMNNLKKGSN